MIKIYNKSKTMHINVDAAVNKAETCIEIKNIYKEQDHTVEKCGPNRKSSPKE